MIQEKAITFAKELPGKFAGTRWMVTTLEGKNHRTFKTVSKDRFLYIVTPEMVDGWWETSLPILLSNFEVKNIHHNVG